MSIIKHYLYHNPTVLYAPNTTAADNIITKVRNWSINSSEVNIYIYIYIYIYTQEWESITFSFKTYMMDKALSHSVKKLIIFLRSSFSEGRRAEKDIGLQVVTSSFKEM